MNIYLRIFLDFIVTFILIMAIYYFFINKKKKSFNDLKKNDLVLIFINKYKLDHKKNSLNKILLYTSLINSFAMSFVLVIILNIDNIIWSILVAFVLMFIIVYSLYELLGRKLKNNEKQ